MKHLSLATRIAKSVIVIVLIVLSIVPLHSTNGADNRIFTYLPIVSGNIISKIAFVSSRDGNDEIYIMNADGSRQTRLTNTEADESTPIWSPDGTKIAFISSKDNVSEVYVMNVDGSRQTRLTNTSLLKYGLEWSHNGGKILFVSETKEKSSIYTMNADGSAQVKLTDIVVPSNPPIFSPSPRWSHDDTRIAFVDNINGNVEISIINANGSGKTRITNNILFKFWLNWSITGDKILFSAYQSGKPGGEIDIVNTNGSELHSLLKSGSEGQDSLSWSPDETKILFITSYSDARREVSTMNADGSNKVDLTSTPSFVFQFYPVWSDDGTKIVFSSQRDGPEEIYIMNADGSNQTRLTFDETGASFRPAWQPRNKN